MYKQKEWSLTWRQKRGLHTSGRNMNWFPHTKEAATVTRALWVASALCNVQPPWQEVEAGSDKRGFPDICPKAPEGSWHLLHLLHQKQQSQEQTIIKAENTANQCELETLCALPFMRESWDSTYLGRFLWRKFKTLHPNGGNIYAITVVPF